MIPRVIAAVLLTALPATADVRLELVMQGYSELFKKCDFDIEAFADETHGDIIFGYEVPVEGKGTSVCEGLSMPNGEYQSSCQSDVKFDYTCEDFTHVRLKWMTCFDLSGVEMPCGAVSLTAAEKGMFRFPDD